VYQPRSLNCALDISSMRAILPQFAYPKAYNAGYKRIFISDRPRKLQSDCYSRVAVKTSWTLSRFKQALEGSMPLTEVVVGVSKSALKRVFGGGVYDWARKTVLKIK